MQSRRGCDFAIPQLTFIRKVWVDFMRKELEKTYDPKQVEDRIYDFWIDGNYFAAKVDPAKKPYTIVIPPPNVTGQLHMGHALDETMQDIIIRTRRMQGYSALWLPGTDHAGIATQIRVEAELRNTEGKTRYDLGRERFIRRVWDWKELYGSRILKQLRKLGSSCDWSRERFTMDEGCSEAVKEVFVNLYNKGLIYRGNRIINWCPRCTTALSDAEVEYNEQPGHFWHIRYPIKGTSKYVVIATTRPETMLGDSAIAVNPEDERYKDIIGKTAVIPLVGREIPIIADDYVDMDFGTGCVKITPCHDPNDFEVGKRHGLEEILIMDENACINKNGGAYFGLDRYAARKQIVADLEKEGFLVKIEEHSHNVGECYRCKTTVEPIASRQWFVKMAPLAAPAIKAVEDGEVKFVPERFSKIYINWMNNIHDWCISRQLWWGHRIPAYYCDDCGEMTVAKEAVTVCPKCGSTHMHQDEDVLDTWFSSALWPFSTLGWPKKTEDLDYFYPTTTLVTAYDIIFFWVARMIFSGIEHTGKPPFKTVFIHGLVRDAQGRKMSKSLGNGIDPLKVIEEYGADALRFALATNNSPGNDMRFSDEKVEASRNFANKLWNAARFVLMNLHTEETTLPKELTLDDKWILSKLNTVIADVTANIDKFELGVALDKVYSFIWDDFCDWYIELAKIRLFAGGEPAQGAERVLVYVLDKILKLLHPFMPFITEEIWQSIPHEGEALVAARYPEYSEALNFKDEEANMNLVMAAIKEIRAKRAAMNIPLSKKAALFIETDRADVFLSGAEFFKRLAGVSEIEVERELSVANALTMVVPSAKLMIPMNELVDPEKERARLNKEKEKTENEINRCASRLNNEGFVSKAPAKLIEDERNKLASLKEMLEKIELSINALGK